MAELKKSIKNSMLWMIFRFIVSISSNFFITILIVKCLNIKEYGIYSLLFSVLSYMVVISFFGIPSIIQRFIPEAFQKGQYKFLKVIVIKCFMFVLINSTLVILIGLVFKSQVGLILKVDNWSKYYSYFCIGIIFYLESTLMTSVLHSLFLHKHSVISSTVYSLLRLILMGSILYFGYGLTGVIIAEVAAWIIWFVMQAYFYVTKFVYKYSNVDGENLTFTRALNYGRTSAISEIGAMIASVSTDLFIISFFLGPSSVSYYAFADRIYKTINNNLPHNFLIDLIRPSFFAKYVQSNDKKQLIGMFNFIVKIGAFFIFPLAGGMIVLGDKFIITLFSEKYLPAEKILWLMALFSIVTVYSTPNWLVLQALEQIHVTLKSKIFGLYNVVLSIFIVRHYGVIGVILVSLSAIIFRDLFCYIYTKKYVDIKLDWKKLSIIFINAAVMSIFIYPLRPFVKDIFSLIFVIIVGLIIYFLISLFNKGFSKKESDIINSFLPYPLFVF